MSDLHQVFEVGDHPRVEINAVWGDLVVLEGDPGTIEVRIDGAGADKFRIERSGDTIVVEPDRALGLRRRFLSADIAVTVPAGCDADLKAGSGDVTVEALAGLLTVAVASGAIRARRVEGTARLKSASGDIRLDEAAGRIDVSSASGEVRIGSVGGDAFIGTASGDVAIGVAGGAVSVKTASGNVEISDFRGDDLEIRGLSGDARIGIPRGRTLDVDIKTMSGEVRNQLTLSEGAPTGAASLRVKTVSGDVVLRPA